MTRWNQMKQSQTHTNKHTHRHTYTNTHTHTTTRARTHTPKLMRLNTHTHTNGSRTFPSDNDKSYSIEAGLMKEVFINYNLDWWKNSYLTRSWTNEKFFYKWRKWGARCIIIIITLTLTLTFDEIRSLLKWKLGSRPLSSGVPRGAEGASRPWRHFRRGGTSRKFFKFSWK